MHHTVSASDDAESSEPEEPEDDAFVLCADRVVVDELPSEEPSTNANDSEAEPERSACAAQ